MTPVDLRLGRYPESVTETAQLPHCAPGPSVELEQQLSRDWIVVQALRRGPLGGIEVPDGVQVARTAFLRERPCKVEMPCRDPVGAVEHAKFNRFTLRALNDSSALA